MSPHLKTLRKRIGVSIGELAERVGESPVTIVAIENRNQCPTDALKEKIARAIGFPVEVIFQDDKTQGERTVLPLHLG